MRLPRSAASWLLLIGFAVLLDLGGMSRLAHGQALAPSREKIRQDVAAGLTCPTGPRLPHVFQFADRAIGFTEFTDAKLLVSSACILVDKRCRCEALRKAAAASAIGVDLNSRKTPGAAICSQSLHGTLLSGTDSSKTVVSFCRFQDGSMISTDTLYGVAVDNDQARPTPPQPPAKPATP